MNTNSSNTKEEADSPSFLNLFWDLAMIDVKIRERATKQLLSYLKEHAENANQPEFPGLSREMIYTLKRLCNGVSSSRDCARQGFSVALTIHSKSLICNCILQFFPSVPLDCVYKTLLQATEIESGMKGIEERDMYFGRIFGILALFRSSRFLNEEPTENTKEIVESCIKELVRLYKLKKWICELCVQTIAVMLRSTHKDYIPIILTQCRSIFEEVKNNDGEDLIIPLPLTPASLCLLLQAQLILHEREISFDDDDDIEISYVKSDEVTPSHLKNYMNIYKECSYTFPKLHPLWNVSIQYILAIADNADSVLVEWWNMVTNQVLTFSPERKGMCLKVCQLLLPHIPTSLLNEVLNSKICNVLTTSTGNKKVLHEMTMNFLNFLVTSTQQDKERRIALLTIFFSTVGMNFDQKTHSSTCKQLMDSLTPEDMNSFITHCYCILLQPLTSSNVLNAGETSDDKETSESEEEVDISTQRRIWALENLQRLILNNTSFDPFLLVDLFLTISCVKLNKEPESQSLPSSLSFLHTDFVNDLAYVTPAYSETVQDKARQLFFSIVNTLAVKVEGKEKSTMGMTKENELYVYLILQHYENLIKKVSSIKDIQLIREYEEEEKSIRQQLLNQIETIHKITVKNPQAKQDLLFERLFVNLALEEAFKPDYSQVVSDLIECYKHFTKPSKNDSERPLAVLLDVILIFLRTSNKALRDSAVQVFGSVCSDLREEDVSEMLSIFWKEENLEEEDDEEDMEMDIDEDGNIIEEEEEDDDDDEEDDDNDEKEKVRKEVKEEEEDDDDEVDWNKGLTAEEIEAMKQEDEAIANVLRIKRDQERLRKDSKSELINYKSRIIDLIESFVTKQPSHPVMATIIISLAEIVQKLLKEKNELALNNRICSLLKNKISKNCILPASYFEDMKKCTEDMKKLIDLSITVSMNDPNHRKQVLICNACCLSVFLRSLQHKVYSVGSEGQLTEGKIEEVCQIQQQVKDLFIPSLEDYKMKRSHLSLYFFETLLMKTPLLFFECISVIQSFIINDSTVSNYRKLEYVTMITCLLRNTGNTPNHDGYSFIQKDLSILDTVAVWAKEKLDNREKEGYEDFRKLPRRKMLTDFLRALENARTPKTTKTQKGKNESNASVMKGKNENNQSQVKTKNETKVKNEGEKKKMKKEKKKIVNQVEKGNKKEKTQSKQPVVQKKSKKQNTKSQH